MRRWRDAAEVYRDRKQLTILLQGFASGMPLLLTLSSLSYWLSKVGVDLKTIGLFALVGAPYTFKFVWAPLVDQLAIPVLDRLLGRRRSWMLVSQVALVACITGLGWSDPTVNPWWTALFAVLIAFFSATQDIAIDAYRIEALAEHEQGAGSATTQLGYRVALWTVDALVLLLPAFMSWPAVFTILAALMASTLVITLMSPEPKVARRPFTTAADWALGAVVAPFAEFIRYRGWLLVLLFAMFYKFGDAIGGTMTRPFLVALGFSGPEIFGVTKSFGVAGTLLGGIVGGVVVARYGLFKALLIGGALQAVTNLLFAWQAVAGHDVVVLTVAITIDNFTGSMGAIALVAYLSSLCTSGMAGTQYALFTSLTALGRTVMSSGSGYLAESVSWPMFWALTTLLAIPGLALVAGLWWLHRARPAPAG
ncbi:MAG: MFS transporter [Rhodospirillales bacterium]|nr:MFS transporter [Rhodospirillales bacterium]